MTMAKLKLISFTLCPYVQRVRIVLLEKNIAHEVEYIDLDAPPPWFFDVSPMEKVPVLLVDEQSLFESMVICDYLDEVSANSLYADAPLLKAQQRAWIAFSEGILDTFYDVITVEDEVRFKRSKATLIDRLESVEEYLQGQALFGGDVFTMVDVSFAPLFRFLFALKQYAKLDFFVETPLLADWAQRLLQRPAVVQSVPESFATELPVYLRRPGSVLKGLIESQ